MRAQLDVGEIMFSLLVATMAAAITHGHPVRAATSVLGGVGRARRTDELIPSSRA